MFFEGFSNGMSQMTYGGPPGLGMRFEDEETVAHLGASMLGDDAVSPFGKSRTFADSGSISLTNPITSLH